MSAKQSEADQPQPKAGPPQEDPAEIRAPTPLDPTVLTTL
jgi:hypothetical protein